MPQDQIVEGYAVPRSGQDASSPQNIQTPWINDLRTKLRRQMIEELATKRIKSISQENQSQDPPRWVRMIEAFLVGVAVTVTAQAICSRARKED